MFIAYIILTAVHHSHVLCLSETYLNSNTSSENGNLNIPGYNLVRADHPSKNKSDGACVCFKGDNNQYLVLGRIYQF